jgi:uncharacterized protein
MRVPLLWKMADLRYSLAVDLRRYFWWSLGLGIFALIGCTHGSNKPGSLDSGVVVLQPPGRTLRLQVEVVRTPEDRARGLMYRRELPSHQGMLFIFDHQEVQSFWMQNTYIPLDMIFIDEAMKIVGVIHNAEPLTTTSRSVGLPSRYVLEVNGGFAKINSIDGNARVQFENLAHPNNP